jgi:hypothetical protein
MLRNVMKGCVVAALLGVWGAACSGNPDSAPAGGAQQFASEDEEATAIDLALSKNPNDPVARKLAREFNARSQQKAGLFHTVDMGQTRLVKFYQNGTRKMVTIEAKVGAPEIKLRTAGRTFAEIYGDLKPGEAVPQAVLDADLRHHELMLQQAAERPVVPAAEETPVRPTTPTLAKDSLVSAGEARLDPTKGSGTELVEKSMSCDEFQSVCPRGGTWDACNCNMTADAALSFNDVEVSEHTFIVREGVVTAKVMAGDETPFREVLGADDFRHVGAWDTCSCSGWGACAEAICPKTHTQNVWNVAEGERYHRGMCNERGSAKCTVQ